MQRDSNRTFNFYIVLNFFYLNITFHHSRIPLTFCTTHKYIWNISLHTLCASPMTYFFPFKKMLFFKNFRSNGTTFVSPSRFVRSGVDCNINLTLSANVTKMLQKFLEANKLINTSKTNKNKKQIVAHTFFSLESVHHFHHIRQLPSSYKNNVKVFS